MFDRYRAWLEAQGYRETKPGHFEVYRLRLALFGKGLVQKLTKLPIPEDLADEPYEES